MKERKTYRLSKDQKAEIANNLIDILEKDAVVTSETHCFIAEWLYTDGGGKSKALYDVWDIVLKRYLPTTRPILFRVCDRIGKNGKIGSFTGRLECANRLNKGKGSLIICDTKETLYLQEEFNTAGEYTDTFYPLVTVLIKARDAEGWGFTDRLLDFIGEDEYIMRIKLDSMHTFKWIKNSYQ